MKIDRSVYPPLVTNRWRVLRKRRSPNLSRHDATALFVDKYELRLEGSHVQILWRPKDGKNYEPGDTVEITGPWPWAATW